VAPGPAADHPIPVRSARRHRKSCRLPVGQAPQAAVTPAHTPAHTPSSLAGECTAMSRSAMTRQRARIIAGAALLLSLAAVAPA
jgi:hypothetical protein